MAGWKRAATIILCSVSAAAQAQDDFPMMDWGPTIQTEAMNSVIDEIGRSEAKRAGLPYPGDRGRNRAQPARPIRATLAQDLGRQVRGAAAPAPVIVGGYAPSAAVQKRLAGIMADATARRDPTKREEMRQLVLSGQAVTEYQRAAPKLGLRANDAIDAYAFYLLAQWSVANDYRPDVTRAQVAGVRRQAATAYAGIADLLRTDALRQEFAEALIIQGAIMAGVHEAAVRSGDNAATARYAAVARRGGEMVFSVDPVRLSLTDAGFRTR